MNSFLFFALLFLGNALLDAKVLIITHAYNHPDFIEMQCRTFQKFLIDDYEYIVFNDAPSGPMHDAIMDMCNKWDVTCIPIPQVFHDHPQEEPFWQTSPDSEGTKRHVDGIQFSLDLLGYDHEGIVAFFDSDLFLIKPFSISEAMEYYDIVSIFREPLESEGSEVKHLWPGLTFLAMNKLPNKRTLDFKCGKINDQLVDTGGYTYYYLKNNHLKVKFIGKFPYGKEYENYTNSHPQEKVVKFKELGFGDKEINWLMKYPWLDVEFYTENCFLHYARGRFFNELKTMAVVEFLEDILND